VLTTDPKDIVLTRPVGIGGRPNGKGSEWDFARGKLQLAFKADGTLDGVIGGYVPLTMYMVHQIGGGAGTVTVGDIDCSSQYRTLQAMADGDRDPATGQCHRISSAIHIEAVPAYVFDHATTTAATK
jgi:hypothetical protein